MTKIFESTIEEFVIELLQNQGWKYLPPEEQERERPDLGSVVLKNRLEKAIDVVLFVNGLPLVVIELKNPADENATVKKAFTQLQNYKKSISSLFYYNAALVASDGLDARTGTISSDFSRFLAWKSSDGFKEGKTTTPQIETLIKGMLNKHVLLDLDEEADEITEGEESSAKEKAKAKWVQLEAIVGRRDRLKVVAADVVDHFEKRREAFEGKGMIVCMSRRIAVELYEEIIKIRPDWHDKDLGKGTIKVVMTSTSSDPENWQIHSTTKQNRKAIGERFKDEKDALKLVIVRDMWLTGFDVPCLHTMYVDKPMRKHNLMQAIARVNRVFKDKPGGLIVDYIGIASDLKTALATYTASGGQGKPTLDQNEAVSTMLEKFEIVEQMFNGFEYKNYFSADTRQKLTIILEAQEHILGLEDGKNRYIKWVTLLSQAFALSVPNLTAMRIKDEVGFYQAIKARLTKFEPVGSGKSDAEIETAIRQIVDKAVVSEGIVDVFAAAGIKKPDISILSDEFLADRVKNIDA